MPAMTSSCRLTSLRWMSGGTVWNHRLPEKACEQIGQVRQRRQRQPRRVTKTPLRCFRSRHPARNVMPATPCIDHQHNRLAAMRPPPDLSDRLTGQWMESIVNRDLETHNVGFVWVPTSRTARRMSRTVAGWPGYVSSVWGARAWYQTRSSVPCAVSAATGAA